MNKAALKRLPKWAQRYIIELENEANHLRDLTQTDSAGVPTRYRSYQPLEESGEGPYIMGHGVICETDAGTFVVCADNWEGLEIRAKDSHLHIKPVAANVVVVKSPEMDTHAK